MEIIPGNYVKAVFDFETSQAGEICIKTGQIILVTNVVDDNWVCGKLDGKEGNIPTNFVEKINVPQIKSSQKLFLSIETFKSSEDGDLNFEKGQIILGLNAVDVNWWKGSLGGKTGIFPKIFVKDLPLLSSEQNGSSMSNYHDLTDSKPKLDSSHSQVPFTVIALVDVTPQLDGELGFKAGDVVTVVEVVDDDWFKGQLCGKEGLVMSICVDLPNNFKSSSKTNTLYSYLTTDAEPYTEAYHKKYTESYVKKSDTQIYKPNIESHDMPYVKPSMDLPNTSDRYGYAFDPNDNVYAQLDAYIETGGKAGPYSYTSENTRSADVVITPYARVLYPFISQSKEEMSINENDIVMLIQHVDPDWIEGEIDGKFGLFPTSYVEIIVDCPYAYYQDDVKKTKEQSDTEGKNTSTNSVKNESIEILIEELKVPCANVEEAKEYEHVEMMSGQRESENQLQNVANDEATVEVGLREGKVLCNDLALVLFTFEPLSKSELSIKKGETLTVLKRYEDNWLEAKDKNGNIGLVPSNHIETISVKYRHDYTINNNGKFVFEDCSTHMPSLVAEETETTCSMEYVEVDVTHTESLNADDTSVNTETESQILTSSPTAKYTDTSTDPPKHPKMIPPAKPKSAPKPVVKLKPVIASKPNYSPTHKVLPKIKTSMSLDSNIAGKLNKANGDVNGKPAEANESNTEMNRSLTIPNNTPPELPLQTEQTPQCNNFSESSSLNPEEINVFISPSKSEPVGSTPPCSKSVSFGLSSFNINDAFMTENNTTDKTKNNFNRPTTRFFKNVSSKNPPGQPNETLMKPNMKSRPLPSRLTPIAPGRRVTPTRPAPPRPISSMRHKKQMSLSQSSLPTTDLMTFSLKEEAENLCEVSPIERKAANIGEETERRKEEDRKRKIEERIKIEKEKDKREKIIEEIIETENMFLKYLHLCMDMFLSPSAEKMMGIDYGHLFGNMEEIADVSQCFLNSLETAVLGKRFDEQIVGTSFVKYAEDMKNTYAPYCRNHDEVITTLEKYNAVPVIKEYFQRIITKMKEKCNVFDLDALLIKPIQRILKYPLLLGELLRNTDDDHIDKLEVVKAINAMTDVAKAINEYKRRKDLVYKYKKESDVSLGDKISKINIHTLKKKSGRIRGRLSNTMGISLQTKDEQFEREEIKFHCLEKAVKVFAKGVQTYIDNVQECISCEESCVVYIVDYYGDKANHEINGYKALYQKITAQHFAKLKSTLEELLIIPLNRLISMLNGPINIIGKRFDKLLDYDRLLGKPKDTEKYNEHLLSAKNDYEAMNAQLLDELPALHTLAHSVLKDCMCGFIQAQKKYVDVCLQQTYTELQLPFMLGAGEFFIESFNVKHTTTLDRLSGLSFIPPGLHRQDNIRCDKQNTRVSLDAGLSRNTKYYKSEYSFYSQGPPEVSLYEGQFVEVLAKQDQDGNTEWWYVDADGNKGYAPSNYLRPI